ncbi:MAG: ABC transporter substrate-binding protein [Peptococcales bacterium]|jgi:ABC-type nitrate/sulfonate/bicarbonate transport system substrate-binding protein
MYNKQWTKMISLLFIVLLVFSLAGCAKEPQKENVDLKKVTITLDWVPNTNHTGLFVAKDKGFYEEAGLDVEIIQPANGTSEQLVGTGKAQFGVAYQEGVTFARLSDVPVVSIAAIIQHNTSGFGSLKEKGIVSPKDFEGKRYGGWGSPIEEATIKSLMDIVGADFSKVEILNTGAADFFVTSEKNADFSWIFFGWDGIAAELKGVELNYIDVAQFDPALDYYTPVLITGEKIIENDPVLVKKFMEATTKGYTFAMENPKDAADILLANAPELDKELVIASQEWLKDKYQADANVWGEQKKSVWENYSKWLYERGLIEKELDVEKAFTNEFLGAKK